LLCRNLEAIIVKQDAGYEPVRGESSSDDVSSLALTNEDLNVLTGAFKDGCSPKSACTIIDANAEPITVNTSMVMLVCTFS
jgi:hypothetical protein